MSEILLNIKVEHGDPLPPKVRAALKRTGRRKTTATIAVGVSPKASQA